MYLIFIVFQSPVRQANILAMASILHAELPKSMLSTQCTDTVSRPRQAVNHAILYAALLAYIATGAKVSSRQLRKDLLILKSCLHTKC